MIVVKFGGSSLAGADRMRAAARIVATHLKERPVVCVVSAMAGVTDQLLRIAALATAGDPAWAGLLADLRDRHDRTLRDLTGPTPAGPAPADSAPAVRYAATWGALELDLHALVDRSRERGASIEHERDVFSGWGERLAVLLFAAALSSEGVAAAAETGEPVILAGTLETPGEVEAALGDPACVAATREWVAQRVDLEMDTLRVPVLPGYIARTPDGRPTTLGRNGSDCSATLVGAALRAEAVYIYSDVAGVHRADPRVIPEAPHLPALTYADAAAIAAAGARVLHPGALRPVARLGIPLRLRSTLNPHHPGTDIGPVAALADLHRDPHPWVIAARPAASGRVDVTATFLQHQDWREPDAPGDAPRADDTRSAASLPRDLLAAAAFDLLHAGPWPAELLARADHITLRVPASQAAVAQRKLFDALERAGSPAASGRVARSATSAAAHS